MGDMDDLRERLVGQRFYDNEQEEAFTVVGITSTPPLALLQYDDGVGWDEGASNFTVEEDIAQQAGLDEDGLDSDRYRPLGAGPRINQICDPGEHRWYPWPDKIWPSGPSEQVREEIGGNPRDYYARMARCKRCGLSGDVARQFGFYGEDSRHDTPWFCVECGDAYVNHNLMDRADARCCPDCVTNHDEADTGK